MIRIMGFVTGAAVAIGLMLFLFGLPELPTTPEAAAPDATLAEVEPVPAAGAAATDAPGDAALSPTEPDAAPIAESEREPEAVAAAPIEPQPAAGPDNPETIVEAVSPATAETLEEPQKDFDIAVGNEPLAADLRWHAFWSPFRSRIAADGFVSRLEAVTGFDYRVVKVDTGVFEVAFAYASDDERLTKLATIEAATGLEMPDS